MPQSVQWIIWNHLQTTCGRCYTDTVLITESNVKLHDASSSANEFFTRMALGFDLHSALKRMRYV